MALVDLRPIRNHPLPLSRAFTPRRSRAPESLTMLAAAGWSILRDFKVLGSGQSISSRALSSTFRNFSRRVSGHNPEDILIGDEA
jgi:hypothetical protein